MDYRARQIEALKKAGIRVSKEDLDDIELFVSKLPIGLQNRYSNELYPGWPTPFSDAIDPFLVLYDSFKDFLIDTYRSLKKHFRHSAKTSLKSP